MATDDQLFPAVPRSDRLPQHAHESHYGFLQRVDDPVFARIRDLLNSWFQRFARSQSVQATKDLRRRLQAKGEGQFNPAFWELYLHELFARLGFDAVVHPDSERGTHPDFELKGNGTRFYLEAVAPMPETNPAERERANGSTVLEYVNAAHRPQFWLRQRYLIPGTNTPKKKEVVKAVEDWLDSLNWEAMWAGDMASSNQDDRELRVGDGWQIGLTAIPMERTGPTDPRRPSIGAYKAVSGFPDSLGPVVRRYLEEKSTRYGQLDAPLVIAVWVLDWMASPETAALALYGGWVEFEDGPQRTGWELREDREGLWTPGAKWRDRAAGVIAASVFEFGGYPGVGRSMPRYWPNPWAAQPLEFELPLATSEVATNESEVANSPAKIDPADLFELPADWPGPEDRFENAYED